MLTESLFFWMVGATALVLVGGALTGQFSPEARTRRRRERNHRRVISRVRRPAVMLNVRISKARAA
jgi:hypothetical protein